MTNLAGRACLPGYGTSRKAVEAGHKLKRGVVAEGLGNRFPTVKALYQLYIVANG